MTHVLVGGMPRIPEHAYVHGIMPRVRPNIPSRCIGRKYCRVFLESDFLGSTFRCMRVPRLPGLSTGASAVSGMSTALSVQDSSSSTGSRVKNGEGLRTARWVKRQLLTRAPKTAEEIALDEKEV